jgi:hypothetical protein
MDLADARPVRHQHGEMVMGEVLDMTKDPSVELDVIVVNRSLGVAILNNGSHVPVTHWFDARAKECTPVDAVSCVAGDDSVGWFSIDLLKFQYATVH